MEFFSREDGVGGGVNSESSKWEFIAKEQDVVSVLQMTKRKHLG